MKNNKRKVSDTLSGGPRQGRENMVNRGSSTIGNLYGNTSRSAGLTRSRQVRPHEDDQMNSAVSGVNPEPERRGNINDGGERPNPERDIESSKDTSQ